MININELTHHVQAVLLPLFQLSTCQATCSRRQYCFWLTMNRPCCPAWWCIPAWCWWTMSVNQILLVSSTWRRAIKRHNLLSSYSFIADSVHSFSRKISVLDRIGYAKPNKKGNPSIEIIKQDTRRKPIDISKPRKMVWIAKGTLCKLNECKILKSSLKRF